MEEGLELYNKFMIDSGIGYSYNTLSSPPLWWLGIGVASLKAS